MGCLCIWLAIIAVPAYGDPSGNIDALRDRAEKGQSEALFDLAARYELGRDVAQDLEKAVLLYEQAAMRGHPEAQYRFGLARATGLALPEDPISAAGWLELATMAEKPSATLAESLLETINAGLDQADQDRALNFAETFTPADGPLDQAALDLLDDTGSLFQTIDPDIGQADAKTEVAGNAIDDRHCGRPRQGSAVQPVALVIDEAPGSAGDDVIPVTPSICDVVRLLDRSDLVDPTIDLMLRNQDDRIVQTFKDGDSLVLDAAAGDVSRQVFIDYVVHDGTVVHLFPNAGTPDNRVPPTERMTIGGPDEWQVAPPYGNDLVILYVSGVPLHDREREESETVDAYLPYLRDRLAALAGSADIGIDYHVVQISAR